MHPAANTWHRALGSWAAATLRRLRNTQCTCTILDDDEAAAPGCHLYAHQPQKPQGHTLSHLEEAQHRAHHLTRLGPEQQQHRGQQLRQHALQPGRKLVQQAGQSHDGGTACAERKTKKACPS